MNREELDREIELTDLAEALDAAKDRVFGGDESDEAHAALKASEEALANARIAVRSSRAASAAPAEGVAAPDPVEVTTEGG